MPVQEHDRRPVPRPSGLIPPDEWPGGVTELRVHGVGGTTPQSLLGDLAPEQVAGDRISGFYRTADLPGDPKQPGRHVEAYSWGGLTSRSGTRALWALLLPFALTNVAGWMCSPKVQGSKALFWLHRASVRWASLALTINFLLIAAITGMDLVGYQCGGQGRCVEGRWWLGLLSTGAIEGRPGRLVLVGALIPLAIVVLFVWLTWRSAGRYEDIAPPFKLDEDPDRGQVRPDGEQTRSNEGAAVHGRGLKHPEFWDGMGSTRRSAWLHLGAGLAFLALVVAYTVPRAMVNAGADVGVAWLGTTALRVAIIAMVAAVALLTTNTFGGRWLPRVVFAVGAVALLASGVFAAVQEEFTHVSGALPGMQRISDDTFLGVLIAVGLVLLATVLGGQDKAAFRGGPFVAVGTAVFVLNLVLLGVMIWVTDRLTAVSFSPTPASVDDGDLVIYISEAVGRSTPYFVGALAVVVVVTGVVTGLRCWNAGRRTDPAQARRRYANSQPPRGAHEDWWYSVLTEQPHLRTAVASDEELHERGEKWLRKLARIACLAKVPTTLDWPLAAIAVVAVVILFNLSGQLDLPARAVLERFVGVGSFVAAWAPVGLLVLLRRGWKDLENRRRLGIMWDVGTFWPRSYHPLAPPSYAERAVPELQRRLWYLHDQEGSVVLAAHSQGTVIAAAALLQADGQRPPDRRVALVTFGAPLQKLYGWAFPYYFSSSVLSGLANPDTSLLAGWRNFFYPTDLIGGTALDGAPAAAEVDRELRDPESVWHVYGQPRPAPGRHSGYWTDPRVWDEVDQFAAKLQPQPPQPPPDGNGRQPAAEREGPAPVA